ncbi:hypothetical protein CDAR_289871 [Caerostris darwini]|uniref:Uncharacterized protein n=1 Tax=Caerostris darwini TaxID=1538125 RepID=A0AAV4WYZ3_9ARAC|nr:hypothetical protein CDAR_289871 [Caerostris darwini]
MMGRGRLENDQPYYSCLLPVKQPFTEWQQIDLIEFLMGLFSIVWGWGWRERRLKWRLFERRVRRQGRNREQMKSIRFIRYSKKGVREAQTLLGPTFWNAAPENFSRQVLINHLFYFAALVVNVI